MSFNINNKLDDTLLISGVVGFVMICLGLVYKSNSEVDEPKEHVDYLEERLKQNRYHFTTVGGSKTRRKKI